MSSFIHGFRYNSTNVKSFLKRPGLILAILFFCVFVLFSIINSIYNITEREVILAATEGNLQVIEKYIDNNGNVNQKFKDGYTLLHMSASFNHLNCVQYLVRNGADVNAKLEISYTQGTKSNPGEDAVAYLNQHLTPLRQTRSCEIALFLIENGANVNSRDSVQTSPLSGAILTKNREMIQLLINNGADINESDWSLNPIYFSILMKDTVTINILLNNNLQLNDKNWVLTPLVMAAMQKGDDISIVKYLISKGANPKISKPLMFAKTAGNSNIYSFLKGKGARE